MTPQEIARKACSEYLACQNANELAGLLELVEHGLTERFDAQGQIVAYDHLPIWPAHTCPTS